MTRLWADANVLLRFLTRDPEDLAERSARLMLRVEQGEITLFISPLVLAEVIWVLRSFYRYSIREIARVTTSLISAPGIEMEDREGVIQVIELASDG